MSAGSSVGVGGYAKRARVDESGMEENLSLILQITGSL